MKARERKALKHAAMTEIRAVQNILRRWDPLNVTPGTVGPHDEYDDYAAHIVSIAKMGCTADELTSYLEELCVESMGLSSGSVASWAHSHKFASEIINTLRAFDRSGSEY